jgi:nucleolar GTP-binding protein
MISLVVAACLATGALARPMLVVQRATGMGLHLARQQRRPRAPRVALARMLSSAGGGAADGAVADVVDDDDDERRADDGALPEPAAPSPTGRLRQVPQPSPLSRILKTATKEVAIDAKEATRKLKASSLNGKQRACRLAGRKLDVLTKCLVVPVRDYQRELRLFLRELHPFERELVRLTLAARERVGGRPFAAIMDDADELRKAITAAGKSAAAACATQASAAHAEAFEAEQAAALLAMLEASEPALLELADLSKLIRQLPSVRSEEPLAVLAGLPNVGKSSLVGALSSATPEVNAYPFTTKRLTLGHVDAKGGLRVQLMDTPGVLAREAYRRNAIEQLTFCALKELRPSVIMYVIDPTGLGGRLSAAHEQLAVRAELRAAYPDAFWIDVLSKLDVVNAAREGKDVGELIAERDEDDSVEPWGLDAAEAAAAAAPTPGQVEASAAAASVAARAVLESADVIERGLALDSSGSATVQRRVSVLTGEGIDELRALIEGFAHAADASGKPLASGAGDADAADGADGDGVAGALPDERLGRRATTRWASEVAPENV